MPPPSEIDLILIAAEPSGDLHGANLLKQLLNERPNLRIAAVAGPQMRKFPIHCIEPMESFQVMGFIDVARALPRLVKLFYMLRRTVLALQPKAVIGIDYPGMNLRLYAALRKQGYTGKVIHYICPTVWAWGKSRIAKMEQSIDLLLAILPFEPACFQKTSLRADYVGHPLVQKVREGGEASLGTGPWLALFPGSRSEEVERNLPLMLRVAKRLQHEDARVKIAVSVANGERAKRVRELAGEVLCVEPEETYALMRAAHLALAKSGTVTLELALHGTPTVVQYAIGKLDVFLAQRVFRIRLPHYALPNIIAGREVFPELFGPNLSEETLWEQAKSLWFDEAKREACRIGCAEVTATLGERDASAEAAQRMLGVVG